MCSPACGEDLATTCLAFQRVQEPKLYVFFKVALGEHAFTVLVGFWHGSLRNRAAGAVGRAWSPNPHGLPHIRTASLAALVRGKSVQKGLHAVASVCPGHLLHELQHPLPEPQFAFLVVSFFYCLLPFKLYPQSFPSLPCEGDLH
jgi:hypothetical protein